VITVHHLNNSRSQRILWLLEELAIPYEIKRYQRDPQTMFAPPELLAIHPLGKSPVITDGSNTIAESGAIIEYIRLHFAEGTAMPPLLFKLVFDRIETTPMPFFIKPLARGISARVKGAFVTPNLQRQLSFMESELTMRDWFAGPEFSAADIQMSFPVDLFRARAGLGPGQPKLTRFLERIHARPAYQSALARGGAYELKS
jgi:glutathione S-transferase